MIWRNHTTETKRQTDRQRNKDAACFIEFEKKMAEKLIPRVN